MYLSSFFWGWWGGGGMGVIYIADDLSILLDGFWPHTELTLFYMEADNDKCALWGQNFTIRRNMQ